MSDAGCVRVFFSIGSNVEPARNLQLACRELAKLGTGLRCSAVFQNPAVGFSGADFLNLVAQLDTHLSPPALIAGLEVIHQLAGRERGSARFGPRELDIDLLLYGDAISKQWKLPRKDLVKYAFVAQPMAELAADLAHPVSGVPMREIWAAMAADAPPMHRVSLALDG